MKNDPSDPGTRDGVHTFDDGTSVPFHWSTTHGTAECSACRAGVCRQKVVKLSDINPESGDLIVHCPPSEFS